MGKNGFIATTLNFPEISEWLAKVKTLINKFNLIRRNLLKFKDTITSFYINKTSFHTNKIGSPHSIISGHDITINCEHAHNRCPVVSNWSNKTKARLQKKSLPYG